MKDRKTLLEEMLDFKNPQDLGGILSDLSAHGWDSEEKLVSLTRGHISSTLHRYMAGELSEHDVEEWANAFEVREDVVFGVCEREQDVFDAVYILANPDLEGRLTPERAKNIISLLKSNQESRS